MSLSYKSQRLTLLLSTYLVVSVCTIPLAGFAADTENQRSTFTNTADVFQAKEYASKVASKPALQVIAAIQAEKKAAIALQTAIQSGNSQVIDAAQNAHRASETVAETVMAIFSGVMPSDIADMRSSKKEWEQIAQDLGIHPGSLGLSQNKKNALLHQSEMRPATSRDLRGGRSMMHGTSPGNISGSQSMGLDHARPNDGDWSHMGGGSTIKMGGNHNGDSGGRMGDSYDGDSGGRIGDSYDGGSGGGMGDSYDGGSGGSSMGGGHGGRGGGREGHGW